jgi:hypothetical protein
MEDDINIDIEGFPDGFLNDTIIDAIMEQTRDAFIENMIDFLKNDPYFKDEPHICIQEALYDLLHIDMDIRFYLPYGVGDFATAYKKMKEHDKNSDELIKAFEETSFETDIIQKMLEK